MTSFACVCACIETLLQLRSELRMHSFSHTHTRTHSLIDSPRRTVAVALSATHTFIRSPSNTFTALPSQGAQLNKRQQFDKISQQTQVELCARLTQCGAYKTEYSNKIKREVDLIFIANI